MAAEQIVHQPDFPHLNTTIYIFFLSLLSWLLSKVTLLQGLTSRAPTLLFNMVD